LAKKNGGGKRRTRGHVIADLSVNHVERRVLLCGFTVERVRHDYGIDLNLFTFSPRGEPESAPILLQLKATDHVQWAASGQFLSLRVEKADLLNWIDQALPVILVVYDAVADKAYWLHVQEYFRSLAGFDLAKAGATITVRVPRSNRWNEKAIRKLAEVKNGVLERLKEVTRGHE
jgi:hypothetical protein